MSRELGLTKRIQDGYLLTQGDKMTFRIMTLSIFIVAVFAVAETLTKDSAPFEFPVTGIEKKGIKSFNKAVLTSRLVADQVAAISWSIPDVVLNGELSLYSPSGALLKSFPVSRNKGTVLWDLGKDGASHGVYVAAIQAGSYRNEFIIAIVK